MSITMIDATDLGDVAGMLRRLADRREAELDAIWAGQAEPIGATDNGRSYVRNLRDAADYHERQATSRHHLNDPSPRKGTPHGR